MPCGGGQKDLKFIIRIDCQLRGRWLIRQIQFQANLKRSFGLEGGVVRDLCGFFKKEMK